MHDRGFGTEVMHDNLGAPSFECFRTRRQSASYTLTFKRHFARTLAAFAQASKLAKTGNNLRNSSTVAFKTSGRVELQSKVGWQPATSPTPTKGGHDIRSFLSCILFSTQNSPLLSIPRALDWKHKKRWQREHDETYFQYHSAA